jgi:hypothetical protein
MASKKQTLINHPLARTENVVVEAVGDETVVYDTTLHVAHALKPLAAAVFAYADGKNTASEIAELASYRLATIVTEADVNDAIEQLGAISLLDGPVLDVQTGVSRRTALKTFAAAGAGSMLVMSIATSAAQACITCTSVPAGTGACTTDVPGNAGVGDCKICQSAGICNTTGSLGHCCCAPCDNTSSSTSYCCQPVCINHTSSGYCPTGTLPLSISVGSPAIACPTGYGAYQASGYQYKCCEVGVSKYCDCKTSAGQCGSWSGSGSSKHCVAA